MAYLGRSQSPTHVCPARDAASDPTIVEHLVIMTAKATVGQVGGICQRYTAKLNGCPLPVALLGRAPIQLLRNRDKTGGTADAHRSCPKL